MAVKKILPLGSQEWCKVQDLFNQYTANNNHISRDSDPSKIKFHHLANSKKNPLAKVFALHGSEKKKRWIRQSRIRPPTMFSSTMRGTRMATPMTKGQYSFIDLT
ncbi:uncharacterized protein VP01_8433g1 [Puccinia sorghi]|uniref:Uncharacterized protein n=1 Tax=Puccinia sorghi TaxID=27349 RepID=A0A0L6UBF6_9BASI|nr:uncharacterized protein VP01_8433g1 [Puccinia sorghi]